MCWRQQECRQKSINQQILTNDSAMSNNDDVGYLRDSSAASVGNRKNHTEDSASYSQTNPTEDCVTSNNDDVGYDVNNSYESASDLYGDLQLMLQLVIKIIQQRIMRQALARKRFT